MNEKGVKSILRPNISVNNTSPTLIPNDNLFIIGIALMNYIFEFKKEFMNSRDTTQICL